MRAVIDIGSNSVRLYIDGQSFNKLTSTTRLGEASLNGFLSKEAIERTAEAVSKFYKEAIKLGAEQIYIFATEAVRSAANSAELLDNVYSLTALTVDVIDSELEGKIGYLGAAIDGYDCAVVDAGGASVEIVSGQNDKILYKKSLPIGAWRVKEICGDHLDAIEDYLTDMTRLYGELPHFDKLIGIGGAATTLAAMDLNLSVYDPKAVHLRIVTIESLQCIIKKISSANSVSELVTIFPSLQSSRAPIILHGAMTFYKILTKLKCTEITISETDNLEGYLRYKKSQTLR